MTTYAVGLVYPDQLLIGGLQAKRGTDDFATTAKGHRCWAILRIDGLPRPVTKHMRLPQEGNAPSQLQNIRFRRGWSRIYPRNGG